MEDSNKQTRSYLNKDLESLTEEEAAEFLKDFEAIMKEEIENAKWTVKKINDLSDEELVSEMAWMSWPELLNRRKRLTGN